MHALVKKDKDESLSDPSENAASGMLEVRQSPPYIAMQMAMTTWRRQAGEKFADDLANNEEYAFLREGPELEERWRMEDL